MRLFNIPKIALPLLAGLLFVFAGGSVFAQDGLNLEVTGEIKTGLFAEQRILNRGEPLKHARMYNNDGDSGSGEGRIRLGLNLTMENYGIRTRFFQDAFDRGTSVNDTNILKKKVRIDYAYAYANAFDEQLKISAGLLGESPWGTGGTELFKELEYTNSGESLTGIRTEIMPSIVPGRLNIGFVLNRADDTMPSDAKEKFGDLFLESVLGIAWEMDDLFAFRFAYRLDRGIDSPAAVVNGERLAYRVEERILNTLLPGMAVWANGYGFGINAGKGSGRTGVPGYIQHWLYIMYDPENFTAGVTTGYYDGFTDETYKMEVRPYYYHKLLDNFLVVGAMAGMEIGFKNGKSLKDKNEAFYNFWFVEPQVKANINSNLYTALVYRFTSGSYGTNYFRDQTTHWVNLRLVYTF